MTNTKIKFGTYDDLGAAADMLRRKIFIDEQGVPEDEVFDGQNPQSVHVVLFDRDKPIATTRLIQIDKRWKIGLVAVEKSRRGQQLGKKIMHSSIQYIFSHEGDEIFLTAQNTARKFYEKLGFAQYGENIVFESGFILVPMKLSKHLFEDSQNFIAALKNRDLDALKRIPKADLHNHFVLGGDREYIKHKTNFDILPIGHPLLSMDEMHRWSEKYIGNHFDSKQMRQLLIEATFMQAKKDGISVLEIGEDVWALGNYFNHDIDELIAAFENAHSSIAPDIELRLQIGLSRHCGIDYLLSCLEPFWGRKEFYSIDLYGDEFAQPIENFIPIYQKARENGLKLKAHIGEWGTAEDVIQGIELLSLDEVQHGIAAAASEEAIDYLVKHHIRLNITPSSNVLLSRVADIKMHPIAKLYRAGVDVTINSDDILIFNSDVSREYSLLYDNAVLDAEELDHIRVNGLRQL